MLLALQLRFFMESISFTVKRLAEFFFEGKPDFYTIGYSGRSITKLISILRDYGVTLVVDVRRFPTSRVEDFKRENLRLYLEENGIKYLWLGDKLGGFRSGGYHKYVESAEFNDGIRRLAELSKSEVVCILCLERKPKHCHRRFIAEALENMGFKVYHIV